MIEGEPSLSHDENAGGRSSSSASLLASQQHSGPSKNLLVKRSHYQSQGFPTLPPVTQMGLAEIDSLISPLIRRRAAGFVEPEIKLMVEEIGRRRHILLSKAPEHKGLKKMAWEEVALNVTLRCPEIPKRTGMQMKKKWNNLVVRTKRMITAGKLKREMRFNGVTTLVTQVLASASQDIRQIEKMQVESGDEVSPFMNQQHQQGSYYDSCSCSTAADAQAVIPLLRPASDRLGYFNDVIVPMAGNSMSASEKREVERSGHYSDLAGGSVSVANAANLPNDEVGNTLSDSDVFINEKASIDDSGDSGNAAHRSHQKVRAGIDIEEDLLHQLRTEHAIRVEILQLKYRYWKLKVDALLRGNATFVDENRTKQG